MGWRTIGVTLSALVLFVFALFLMNQTAQAVTLANTWDPQAGRVVLVVLLAVYAAALLIPLAIFVRIPKPLAAVAPESPEYPTYLDALARRVGVPRDGLEAALRARDLEAEAVIKRAASTVFVTTAVSQNGRLDGIMVLALQARLIWQVARTYRQRPAWRETAGLYANVAGAVLFAASIEDLDLGEQIQPVVQAALAGTAVAMVPGFSAVSTIVLQSLLEGSANAYLTLRVGLITREYCRGLAPFDARRVRRPASIAAAGLLGSIVTDAGTKVARAIVEAAKRAGSSTARAAVASLQETAGQATHWLNPFRSDSTS